MKNNNKYLRRLKFSSLRIDFESLITIISIMVGICIIITFLSVDYSRNRYFSKYKDQSYYREFSLTNSSSDFNFFTGNQYSPIRSIGRATTKETKLALSDINEVKKNVSSIKYGYISSGNSFFEPSKKENNQKRIMIWRATYDFIGASNLKLVSGDFFSKDDSILGKNLLVVSRYFAKQRFKGINPIGQKLFLKEHELDSQPPFTIVGVFEPTENDTNFASETNLFGAIGIAPYKFFVITQPTPIKSEIC